MKKIVCLLMIGILTAGLAVGASAFDGKSAMTQQLAQFKEDMQDMYTSTKVYTVTDASGKDVTEVMYADTKEFEEKDDWQSIYQYFIDNIQMVEKQEIASTNNAEVLSLDLSKTETKTFNVKLTPVSGLNYPNYNYFVLRCQVQGTIYYDPNTYKISSTRGPWVLNSSVDGGGSVLSAVNKIPKISADGYSAWFESVLSTQYKLDEGGIGLDIIKFAQESLGFTLGAE